MISYLLQGIWTAKNCVLLGIILYIIGQGVLLFTKKRSFKDFRAISKLTLFSEMLLTIYVCTILNITGIIGREFSCDFSISALKNFMSIPFVGASMKMVTLNFLLFVPYGLLIEFVFKKWKVSWGKALLIGFCSSLFIELLQAFTGRLPESDDLIINTAGFFVGFLVAQAIEKKGIIQFVSILLTSTIVLFLLSFVANGDAMQEEQDAYYNGIGNGDEEIAAISRMNIYRNGAKYDVSNSSDADYFTWYRWMGNNIDNQSSFYKIESQFTSIETIMKNNKTYIEVEYAEPQLFRFYNNMSWEMENVEYLVFCVEDGTLWYGSSQGEIKNCAYYEDANSQYQADENLLDDINSWLAEHGV